MVVKLINEGDGSCTVESRAEIAGGKRGGSGGSGVSAARASYA
jgi:hypothetical protein